MNDSARAAGIESSKTSAGSDGIGSSLRYYHYYCMYTSPYL